MISDNNVELLKTFAKCGFEFFPLVKPWGGKKLGEPKGWPTLGTSDLAIIGEWLNTSKFGFGMTFERRTHFAIDLDGAEGVNNFKKAMKDLHIPEPSLVFSTPSGGRHLIYEYPDGYDIKNVAGWDPYTGKVNAGTCIDVRASGGYIGSFGARENGYILVMGNPSDTLKPLPQIVIDTLPVRVSKAQIAASALAMTKDMIGAMDSIDNNSALYGVIPKTIYDGERDNTLFNLIASWVRGGLDRTNIDILANEAITRCEGDTKTVNVSDMIDRTVSNPDFVFAKRSKALQILLKDLVFLTDINKFITLHDKAIMIKDACETKFSTLIEVGSNAKGEPKYMPLFKVWKNDDAKLIFRDYGYKPSSEAIYYDEVSANDLVNTYKKPEIIPKEEPEIFDLFCEFAETICDGADKGMMLVEFIAHLVQKPAIKIGIAPVIISLKQGIGKNFFIKIVTKILGGSNVTQLYSDNVSNNFNSSIATSQLIMINESIGDQSGSYTNKSKNQQAMARLKSMITDYNQPVERKGHDIVTIRTYTNFLFFSNDIAAVSFDSSDRRFLCMINDQPPQDKTFFDKMDILKTKRGVSAVLHGLQTLDLCRVSSNMTHTEKTLDDVEVMANALTGHEEEIFNDIESSALIFRATFISTKLFTWYCVHKFGMDTQRDSAFINKLRKQFFVPLYPSKKYRQAKQITVDVDPFFVPIRNGTDSVSFGGKEVHAICYQKPSHSQGPIYAESLTIDTLRKSIQKCADNFAEEVSQGGGTKPNLSVINNEAK